MFLSDQITRIVFVDFDVIDQLLKVRSVFVSYWKELTIQCSNTSVIYILEGHEGSPVYYSQ